jgi:hypothetical protein
LLLLVENFDLILEQINDERDNARLRDALMNDGAVMLLGGATTFFREARAYDAAAPSRRRGSNPRFRSEAQSQYQPFALAGIFHRRLSATGADALPRRQPVGRD